MEREQHGKDSYNLNPVMVTSLSDDLAFFIITVLQEQKKLLLYRRRT